MPRGTPAVYLGQEGTGAATVFGGSSFDPVAAARGALNMGLAAKKAADDKKNKAVDDLLKSVDIKGLKLLDTDTFNLLGARNRSLMNKATQKYKDNGGSWSDTDLMELRSFKTNTDTLAKTAGYQKDLYDKYNQSIIGDTNGQLNQKAMKKRQAMYLKPDMFENEVFYNGKDFVNIGESFKPIMEQYENDEDYADDPDAAKQAAIVDWRQRVGNNLLTPSLSPESLVEDFNKNRSTLVNTVVDSQKNGSSQLGEVTNIIERSFVEDTQVELPDGSKVTIPGVKTTAGINFDTNNRIKESAIEYFSQQDPTIMKNYLNQNGNDLTKSARAWYQDDMAKLGVKADIKEVNKPGTMKSHNYNGYGFNSEFDFVDDKGSIMLNNIGMPEDHSRTGGYVDAYKKTTYNGFKVVGDNGKPLQLLVAPTEVYDANRLSWNPDPEALTGNYNLKVNKIFTAPVLNSPINLNDPKFAGLIQSVKKTVTGSGVPSELANIIAKKGGQVPAGIILSDNEMALIKAVDPSLLASRGFVGGSMTTQEEGVDSRTGGTRRKSHALPGAIIPVDQINKEFLLASGADPEQLLISSGKYGSLPVYGQGGQVNPQVNTGGGQKKEEQAPVTPKKTAYGKEYMTEDNVAYYDADGDVVEYKEQ